VYLKSSSRLAFLVIFLHFLQKYRCVSKFGFSADISIAICVDLSIDISIGILTDKEEGGRKEWTFHSNLTRIRNLDPVHFAFIP